jgi:tRNA (guanine37-N1)-methyltransferase
MTMRIDIITLFPEMVRQAAGASIVGRAQTAGILDLRVHDLRDWAEGRHRQADDAPFGGGAGMVMMPKPVFAAVESVLADQGDAINDAVPVLLTAPDGERFSQAMAQELAATPRFVILCGHYEGIDERVRETIVTRAVSIGDYVLTGGELPALVVLDAVTRLLPGVLGNESSAEDETFGASDHHLLLEYPHYTRPAIFREMAVPATLLSGNHGKIADWRRQQSLVRTREHRPDLWEKFLPLSKRDQKLLDAYDDEKERKAEAS